MHRRSFTAALFALVVGCSSKDEPPSSVSTAKAGLVAAPLGGLAFFRLDGLVATGDAKSNGFQTLWTGYPTMTTPLFAVQGPNVKVVLPKFGSYLTYEWTGTQFVMRGKIVPPSGQPSTTLPAALDTFQGATHVTAIPNAADNSRDVFLYDSSRRTAELWRYGYNPADSTFHGSRQASFSGFGYWDQIVGYPNGVLFFNRTTNEVWRGRFGSTGFTFARLPSSPNLGSDTGAVGTPFTDVEYVEARGAHLFYNRNTGGTRYTFYNADTDSLIGSLELGTNMGSGYDRLTAVGSGAVLFYNSSTGVGRVFNDYFLQPTQTFLPEWQAITRIQ